mgnify:CR=1 FL=1
MNMISKEKHDSLVASGYNKLTSSSGLLKIPSEVLDTFFDNTPENITLENFRALLPEGKDIYDYGDLCHKAIEKEMEKAKEIEKLKDVIIGIRNIRNNMNVHPSRKSKLIVVTENYKNLINESESILNKLGFAESIELKNNKNGIPSNAVSVVTDGIEVFMPFEDLVDLEAENERLQNEKTKLESEVARATKMLSNPGFVNKAPEAKINEEKAKLVKYQEMLDSVNERLKNI